MEEQPSHPPGRMPAVATDGYPTAAAREHRVDPSDPDYRALVHIAEERRMLLGVVADHGGVMAWCDLEALCSARFTPAYVRELVDYLVDATYLVRIDAGRGFVEGYGMGQAPEVWRLTEPGRRILEAD